MKSCDNADKIIEEAEACGIKHVWKTNKKKWSESWNSLDIDCEEYEGRIKDAKNKKRRDKRNDPEKKTTTPEKEME
jgi:hypothetical protein